MNFTSGLFSTKTLLLCSCKVLYLCHLCKVFKKFLSTDLTFLRQLFDAQSILTDQSNPTTVKRAIGSKNIYYIVVAVLLFNWPVDTEAMKKLSG